MQNELAKMNRYNFLGPAGVERPGHASATQRAASSSERAR